MRPLMIACMLVAVSTCIAVAADKNYIDQKSYMTYLDSERIFPGWSGITFMCNIDQNKPLEENICHNVTLGFEQLCATNNIKLKVVEPNKSGALSWKILAQNLMPLELKLYTTNVTNPLEVVGIYAELYSDLWIDDAVSLEDVLQKRQKKPRAGNLVGYSDSLVANGIAGEIAPAISDALEQKIKQFLVKFKKNNKEHLLSKKENQ
jgi:hypothetical protein